MKIYLFKVLPNIIGNIIVYISLHHTLRFLDDPFSECWKLRRTDFSLITQSAIYTKKSLSWFLAL